MFTYHDVDDQANTAQESQPTISEIAPHEYQLQQASGNELTSANFNVEEREQQQSSPIESSSPTDDSSYKLANNIITFTNSDSTFIITSN